MSLSVWIAQAHGWNDKSSNVLDCQVQLLLYSDGLYDCFIRLWCWIWATKRHYSSPPHLTHDLTKPT